MSEAVQSTHLAERQSSEVQQHSAMSETATIMSVIERVASNPDADITKLSAMLDMQERVLNRNAKQSFTADLAAMQLDLPRVVERGEGHNQAKYARLEDINDQIRPTLHKYGFAITFRVKHDEGKGIFITTVLSHREGHSEETTIPLAPDTSGSKNAVQAIGSTISYGKRYGICALLNISTGDDDDGQSADPTHSGPETISREQTMHLMSLIQKAKTTPEWFCKKARVNAVHDLQAARYEGAVKMLEAQGGAK